MEKSEQEESNPRTWYQKPLLYPLSYIPTVAPLLSFKASASRRKTSLFGPDTRQQDKQ